MQMNVYVLGAGSFAYLGIPIIAAFRRAALRVSDRLEGPEKHVCELGMEAWDRLPYESGGGL